MPSAPVRILQFGAGNFLRAFIDWMVLRMRRAGTFDGSVAVVQAVPEPLPEAFRTQGNAYTVVLRGLEQGRPVERAERVDVISRRIEPYLDYRSYLEAAADPDLRVVVSNTTEAGIAPSPDDRAEDHPAPSFPGKLTQLLRARYLALGPGPGSALLVLPCELIEANGRTLRELVLGHAGRWYRDSGFERWLTRDCTFVDTLVDRIVSGHDPATRARLRAETGFDDALLAVGEPYHLLAIQGPEREDLLPLRRSGLNAVWTGDLAPYRWLKVRILNGGHTFLAMTGLGLGLGQVRECLEHPLLGRALERLYAEEVVPALPLPAEQGHAYVRSVLERFGNPYLEHRLESIALNSAAKWRARLLPTLADADRRGGPVPPLAALSLAALVHRYLGDAAVQDGAGVLAAFRRREARDADADPAAFMAAVLGDPAIWGGPMEVPVGLPAAAGAAWKAIRASGMAGALEQALAGGRVL
jgi:tagaturonate reductase